MALTPAQAQDYLTTQGLIDSALTDLSKTLGGTLKRRSWMSGNDTIIWAARDTSNQAAVSKQAEPALQVSVQLSACGGAIDVADFIAAGKLLAAIEATIVLHAQQAAAPAVANPTAVLPPITGRQAGCPPAKNSTDICSACNSRHKPRSGL